MSGSHELEDGGLDLSALFRSELRILSDATRRNRGTQRNHNREMNPVGAAQTSRLISGQCHEGFPEDEDSL
jgi:hypothetical protein